MKTMNAIAKSQTQISCISLPHTPPYTEPLHVRAVATIMSSVKNRAGAAASETWADGTRCAPNWGW